MSAQDRIALLYDNFIVKVNLKNDETIYLSPIHILDYNLLYDLNGMSYYSLNNNSKISCFTDKAFNNKADVKGNFTIQDNAINGKLTSAFSDKLNPYFKLNSSAESAKSLLNNSERSENKYN